MKEAVLAVKLERELSKDEILERYLNTIYFGRGAYGVERRRPRRTSTRTCDDIGLLEASYLAGLIRSPGGADALENPEEATRRRSTVLEAMAAEGYITGEERDVVDAVPIETDVVEPSRTGRASGGWRATPPTTTSAPSTSSRRCGGRSPTSTARTSLYGGGLRIYTTLDFDMQRAAWDAVTSTLDQPTDPDAALVAVDQYGYVKAMVGGRDFEADEVNLALGAAGRRLRPRRRLVVQALRARRGHPPGHLAQLEVRRARRRSRFADVQGAEPGEPWKVGNYGGTEQGVLDLVDATRVSSNTAYAQLMLEVGPGNVATLANRLGVSAELPAVPSLVLGSGDVSPLDMAVGYSTFANRGVHNDPILIAKIEQVDEDGDVTVIDQAVPTGRAGALRGGGRPRHLLPRRRSCRTAPARRPASASRRPARPAPPRTTRTPGSSATRPKLTAAVWMGYADPLPDGSVPTMDEDSPVSTSRGLNGVTGGSLPAAIWRKFMVAATAGVDTGSFVEPTEFPGTRPARRARADDHHGADLVHQLHDEHAPRRRPSARPPRTTTSTSTTDLDHHAPTTTTTAAAVIN